MMTWMLAGPSSGQRKDFPGSPVVKTSPSNAGCAGSIPGWGEKIPYVQKTSKTRSNIVTNSTKTLNMVYIKKKERSKGTWELSLKLLQLLPWERLHAQLSCLAELLSSHPGIVRVPRWHSSDPQVSWHCMYNCVSHRHVHCRDMDALFLCWGLWPT